VLGNLPAVVQCAAGKDRTGVVCAVLLSALGVTRETVIEDYLLSNRYWAQAEIEPYAQQLRESGIEPESVTALFGISAGSLSHFLAAIDATSGGIDRFLTDFLHIEDTIVERLKDALITAAA
jgi:protein-tyrosine phosphatase